jgi:HD-like signal output (HDOD) protein
VNSAYFSLPSKINSISQSVVFLGMNTLKNLALNFSAMGMLPKQNAAGFDMQAYLMHSLLTANLTRMLVERFADGEADPTDAYTVGLLHNFGKIVFAQFMPQEFLRALELAASEHMPLHEAEDRVIGADHALVGAMLARHWQFAPSLSECIGGHHQGNGEGALAECLHVADLIGEQLCAENDIEAEGIAADESLPTRFGGDLEQVRSKLGRLDKIVENARSFCQSEASL